MRLDFIEFYIVYVFNYMEKKYDMWMIELQKIILGFFIYKILESWDGEENGCGVWFGIVVLYDRGGIYVFENFLLMKFILLYWWLNFKLGLNEYVDEISFIFVVEKEEKFWQLVKFKKD